MSDTFPATHTDLLSSTALAHVVSIGPAGEPQSSPVNGRTAVWLWTAQVRHEGHSEAGGVEKDVTFVEDADPNLNDQLDAAYRSKYRRYAKRIVESIVTAEARAATLKLMPRS